LAGHLDAGDHLGDAAGNLDQAKPDHVELRLALTASGLAHLGGTALQAAL
jgi:hypothetical protein